MFSRVRLRNFKSFRNLDYEARMLNVLTGLNGSGKSSLLQGLLFLKTMTAKSEQAPWFVGLNGEDHSFGTYADLHYAYSQSEDDCVRLGFDLDGIDGSFSFSLCDAVSNADEVVVESEAGNVPPDIWQKVLEKIRNIQFVSAYRLPPQLEHIYSVTKVSHCAWGAMGEYAVGFLAQNGQSRLVDAKVCHASEPDAHLLSQVNAWMGVVSSGAQVTAEMLGKYNKALLSISFAKGVNHHAFLPQNVGFGISYVLPIVVMLLCAEPGNCLIIENPEAHLHPRGQAELGRLISLVAARGVQIFVESHSDHVLNGIRVAVKNGDIKPESVNVSFFSRQEVVGANGEYEQESEVQTIRIASTGEFDRFPVGFMDEWNKQLLELLQ